MQPIVQERLRNIKHAFTRIKATTQHTRDSVSNAAIEVEAISGWTNEIIQALAADREGKELYRMLSEWLDGAQDHILVQPTGYWAFWNLYHTVQPSLDNIVIKINAYMFGQSDETVLLPKPPKY